MQHQKNLRGSAPTGWKPRKTQDMTPDVRMLQKLADLSSQLNAESDKLNQLILDLEAKLSAMNIGLTYWSSASLCEEERMVEDEHGRERKVFFNYGLGYCKVDSGWRIVVREEKYNEGVDGQPDYDRADYLGHSLPLVNASRAIRAEAAGCLDNLIEGLIKKTESYLKTIERAKDNLG